MMPTELQTLREKLQRNRTSLETIHSYLQNHQSRQRDLHHQIFLPIEEHLHKSENEGLDGMTAGISKDPQRTQISEILTMTTPNLMTMLHPSNIFLQNPLFFFLRFSHS